ncbi:VirD4-like conjugal transfer protein, CD1115 family [Ruminococcus sp.]|uniref:VirD4-like conjugal transfer protein, CD1115 family n=1 Tax=Ruminococcus sp. TaxID=41978 RepID=UPI003FD7B1E2
MFAVIGGVTLASHIYNLNSIKSKTVGDGQHGTSRFSTNSELRRIYKYIPYEPKVWRKKAKQENLNLPQGVILGVKKKNGIDYAMVDDDDVHTLMIGAAGCGKTAFWLYPNLEYACAAGMSFLTTDTKGDLYRNYGNIAKKYYGYDVAIIDLRNPTKSDGNNLLHLVNKYMDEYKSHPENIALKAKAEKYAKIIAKTLIFSDGDAASYGQNAFFYDAAEGLMTAVILLIAEFAPPEQRHIVSVFKLIQDLLAPSGVKGKNQFQLLIEKLPPEHKTRWFAGAALNTSDQAMASIMSTAMSRLNAFLDSELEQILCFDTTIDAEKFCSSKCAIFIVLPEENPATYFMVSLLLQQLYREILTVADEHGGTLKNRVMFYMDEFGTLPAISSAEMMYSASRSRKLSLVSIIQSYKQLEKNYGSEGADIIKDNCQVTIAGGFAPTSGTADEISKSLGTRTVMTGSVSRSKNDPSQSLQMTERPLMTADELKSMKKGNFIVMKTGTHPFVSKLKLFFKWGIEFDTEKYTVPDKGARKVSYTNKEIIENNMLKQYPDSYYPPSRSARRSASGGQALSQSNEPLFREPEQSVRTD